MTVLNEVRIRRIFENKTQEGKPYWVIQTDEGKRISFFEEEMMEDLQEGDIVDIEYTKRGKYLNGKAVSKADVGAEEDSADSDHPGESSGSDENGNAAQRGSREESIERQSAVRSAAILFQGREMLEDEFRAMAKEIYSFIRTGDFGEG